MGILWITSCQKVRKYHAHTVGKLFNVHNHQSLYKNKTGNLNRLVTRKETELAIKKKLSLIQNDFNGTFYQTFKWKIILHKWFCKV